MAEEFFPEEEPPSTFEARNIIDVSVRRASTVALPSSIVGASSVEAPAPVTPVSTRKPGLGSLPEDVEVDGSIKDSRRSSLQGQPRRTRSKTWALGVDDLSEQAEKNLHDWEESVGDSDTDSAKRVRSNKKARPGSEAATPSTVRAGAVSPSRRTTTDQPHYTERRKLKIRHKLNAVGEVIYKGHTSYMIMKCIQMGVRVTVGQITPLEQRDLTVEDFASYIKQAFPTTGTETTPPHGFQDFKFKDYSPMVFRHLRERFRIDPADYMVSLCGDDALRILPTPGKSGALFFFSEDQKYIIKTLPKRESKLLRQILPSYYQHVMQYPNTMLPKFFGLHRVKVRGARNVRFVVMGNIFETHLSVDRRFDLKGSTVGRAASFKEKEAKTVTLKDLDFLELKKKLVIGEEWRALLLGQLRKDVDLLKSANLMDYSLLVGIHNEPSEEEWGEISRNLTSADLESIPLQKKPFILEAPVRTKGEEELRGLDGVHSPIVMVPTKGVSAKDMSFHIPAPLTGSLPRIMTVPFYMERGMAGLDENGERKIFFIGIIDILMKYTIRKQLEHAYKGLKYDKNAISAVSPPAYAERFFNFMKNAMQ